MGISSFVSQFIQQAQRAFPTIITSSLPSTVESLSIDLNSLLHQAAQKFFAYGTGEDPHALEKRRELLQRMSPADRIAGYNRTLASELTTVLTSIRPTQLLVIAVDGVAPLSKINQQRTRRLVASIENPELVAPSGYFFDSSNITPGTDFMFEVDKFIQSWVKEQLDPRYIIYSSFLTPGEGEQKIFALMREGAYKEGPHIIYGLDADLIVLSLLATYPNGTPVINIYLVRDQQILSIDDLRDYILTHVDSLGDFAIMTFLAGNDFLPDQPMVSDIGKFLTFCLQTAKSFPLPLTDEDNILWDNVKVFLSKIAEREKEFLTERAILLKEKNEALPKNAQEDSPLLRALSQGSGGSTLSAAARQLTKNPGRYSTRPTYSFDIVKFKKEWYTRALGPVPEYEKAYNVLMGSPFSVSNETISPMVANYMEGLAWTYLYYKKGGSGISQTWLYKYLYTPLLSDLSTFFPWKGTEYLPQGENLPINPVYQLLAVMPPKVALKKDVIPIELQYFFTSDSPIWDFYPTEVLIDRVESRSNHGVVVHIAYTDIGRIIDAIEEKDLDISRYDPIESYILERNENTVLSQREQLASRSVVPTVVRRVETRGRGYRGGNMPGRGMISYRPKGPPVELIPTRGRGQAGRYPTRGNISRGGEGRNTRGGLI